MALILDASKQLRSIVELTELVHAIATAPFNESEPDWLEWKREADLTERRWLATIGKCIAGFANREPIVARQRASGCAYMILGAEPGHVGGVNPIDNADLHTGISRYVRSTVRWSPQYIRYDGKQVLVVTVEPPEYGDPIVAMLTGFQPQERSGFRLREGDVFIRRHGKTEPAKQEDYDMLLRRSASVVQSSGGVSVQALDTVMAVPVARECIDIARWRERREREFLEPLEMREHETIGSFTFHLLERRSPSQYRAEIAAHLSDLESLLPSVARSMALEERDPGMLLLVVNETEHNFAGARVEVFIEGDVWAHRKAGDALPNMPKPPRKWRTETGMGLYLPDAPKMPMPDIFGPYIDNSGSANIRFDDVDLRPNERVKLDPIHLVCDASLAGATLTAKWTATSSNARGVSEGQILIEVATEVFALRLE